MPWLDGAHHRSSAPNERTMSIANAPWLQYHVLITSEPSRAAVQSFDAMLQRLLTGEEEGSEFVMPTEAERAILAEKGYRRELLYRELPVCLTSFNPSEWEEADISAMPKDSHGDVRIEGLDNYNLVPPTLGYIKKNYWRNTVTGELRKEKVPRP